MAGPGSSWFGARQEYKDWRRGMGFYKEKNACQCEDQLLIIQYIIMTPLQRITVPYLLPVRVLPVDVCHFRWINLV